MKKANCPACNQAIQLQEKLKFQDLISCPNCNSLLKLVQSTPNKLDWAEDPEIFSTRRNLLRTY